MSLKSSTILVAIWLLAIFGSTTQAKLSFGTFLTEDNELLFLDNQPKLSNKSPSSITSSAIEKNKSKLIVNIIYASKTSSTSISSPQRNDTSKDKLVYISSSSMNPCRKNACKPNETCLMQDTQTGYKCVAKVKKSNGLLDSAKTQNRVSQLKLKMYQHFENWYSSLDQKKTSPKSTNGSSLCQESVSFAFNKMDLNRDQLIGIGEVEARFGSVESKLYDQELVRSCDLDQNSYLDLDEFCSCFQSFQPKCSFIRSLDRVDSKNIYISYVKSRLAAHQGLKKFPVRFDLNAKNYVPLCDSSGYFLSTQCDRQVNCWCVRKNGEPILSTFRKIHENTIDCSDSIR
jgi:hypothetical protein